MPTENEKVEGIPPLEILCLQSEQEKFYASTIIVKEGGTELCSASSSLTDEVPDQIAADSLDYRAA